MLESLRTLASPTGQSPPQKKVRGPDDTREIGTQMEVGEIISPDPAAIPLPVSPVLGTIRKIDRGCFPIDWGVDVAMASSYSGRDVGTETSQRVTGGVTSAESSFMALLGRVVAGEEASQTEINQLRDEMESLSRDIVSLAGEARKASIPSIALNKETKKKRAKKKRKGKPESKAIPLVVPPVSEAVGELSRLSLSELIRTPIVEETWATVTSKRARRRAVRDGGALALTSLPGPSDMAGTLGVGASKLLVSEPARATYRNSEEQEKRERGVGPVKWPRLPSTAEISITILPGSSRDYRMVMTEARQKISLDQLGIANSVIKPVINGGLLIQIPGRDRNRKADDLAGRMRALWDGNQLIKITRPSKFAEVRVRGFDVLATTNDVALAVVEVSGCVKEDVRVGALRWNLFGSGSAWMRCPILAVRKALEVGKVSVGWGEATMEPLRARSIICYRCLRRGHFQQQCNSEIGRGNRCYRCGVSGHQAVQCSTDKPKCPLCSDLGLATEHVLGEKGCAPHMRKLQGGQITCSGASRAITRPD